MSTQQEFPRLPSQTLLKLYTSVPVNEIRKFWKFQLQNLSSSGHGRKRAHAEDDKAS